MQRTAGVVTVIYNSTRHLEGFIDSLLRNIDTISYVVFVDNNSSDDYSSFLKRLEGIIPYTVIHNIKNAGYSFAVNQGIAILRERQLRHILVTNNDITIEKRGIQLLLDDMDTVNADVIGIPTTNNQVEYVINNNYDIKTGKVHHVTIQREGLLEKINTKTVEKTTYVQGGVVLFNESFFKKIGVYDPFLFFGGDELDFLLRITHSKIPVACYISLRAWNLFDHHTHHDNRFKFLKAKMMIQGVVYVLLKHNFGPMTLVFRKTVRGLFIDLGKKNIKRYIVLFLFLFRGTIVATLELLRNKFINKAV